jgi:hypothetical protein
MRLDRGLARIVPNPDPKRGIDRGHYCVSTDYRFGEEGGIEPGLVLICHVTKKRGNRQLCIPEESSDFLSF